jgi:hypothetical protein
MTLVFRGSGALLQVQAGLTDIVTAYTAANVLGGWVGGLDGVRNLLKSLQLNLKQRFWGDAVFSLSDKLASHPFTGVLLTGTGPVPYTVDSDSGIFGGHRPTQLIGLTICALAHECGGPCAVQLFMKCIAPVMFGATDMELDAMYTLLNDEYQRILNEGATRGLSARFSAALDAGRLPSADREWMRSTASSMTDIFPPELNLVGGMLKWVVHERRSTYFTRSSLVARVAVSLREAGYLVGSVHAWDGSDHCSTRFGAFDVVLVLGGSFKTQETDPFQLQYDEQIPTYSLTHHYSFRTTGGMLCNASLNQANIGPEACQAIFEDIHAKITACLVPKWKVKYVSEIDRRVGVALTWRTGNSEITNRAIAVRLASLHFKLLAETIAFCYEDIATQEVLTDVLAYKKSKRLIKQTKNVTFYRVTTASIILAMVSCLAGQDFDSLRHSTSLMLHNEHWLQNMCACLDKSESFLGISQATTLVAAVHAGVNSGDIPADKVKNLVGWRSGIYAVVPSLLLVMQPTSDAIGIRCVDSFWGNAIVYEDGSIRSGSGSGVLGTTDDLPSYVPDGDGHRQTNNNGASLQRLHGLLVAPPQPGLADTPLYLSLERPVHYHSHDLALRGRVEGRSVGTVNLIFILETLLHSLEAKRSPCPGHETHDIVYNVKVSRWIAEQSTKVMGGQYNTFVPVQNDASWALFLAGETSHYHGRIVFGCPQCVADPLEKGSVLIGYGQ